MKQNQCPMLLAVGLLLVACSGDSGAATTTTTTLQPTSTSAASANTDATAQQPASTAAEVMSTMDLPMQYGPAVLVAGREDCDLDHPSPHGTWTTDSDGTALLRDGWFECVVTNNDARIAGTAHYTLNMDQWAMPDEVAAQAMWGTIRIENEGGAWDADYVGVYTDSLGDVFTALFTGTGDYAGLSYYQWAVETHGASWPTKGLIFPAASEMSS